MSKTLPPIVVAVLLIAQPSRAGAPPYEVWRLRIIEVRRCERVTLENVALVSSAAVQSGKNRGRRSPAEIVEGAPGDLVEAVVRRTRDLTFSSSSIGQKPVGDTGWAAGARRRSVFYFLPDNDQTGCKQFAVGPVVNIFVMDKSECDTYPPRGECLFDYPIRPVDKAIWDRYGERTR